jgi:ferredoxin--NADP+ reductase
MSFLEATVVQRIDWAEGLCTLRLDATLDAFEPGQFVNLGLRIGGELVRRSYSMASAPGEPLEFYLVRVEGGALSPRLCALGVGDSVHVERQPQGFFTLRYVPEARDAWLLATGTGLGPFMSMIRSGLLWQRFENVVVAHGVRQATLLGYAEELGQLAQTRPGVRYLQLVTREAHATALRARIPAALRQGLLDRSAGLELHPAHSHVLLCGNPAMVEDATAALAERGLRKHRQRRPGHVSAESYW